MKFANLVFFPYFCTIKTLKNMFTKKKTMKMGVKRPLSEGPRYKYPTTVQCVSQSIDFMVSAVGKFKMYKKILAVAAVSMLLFVVYMNVVSGMILSALPILLFIAEPWVMSVWYAVRNKFAGGLLGKQLKLSALLTAMHIVVCAIILAPSLVLIFMDSAVTQSTAEGDNVLLPSGYMFWLNLSFVFAAIVLDICIILNHLSQRQLQMAFARAEQTAV